MTRILLRRLLLFFLPVVLTVCALVLYLSSKEARLQRAEKALVEREQVHAGLVTIHDALKELSRDLHFLVIRSSDELVLQDERAFQRNLTRSWLAFLKTNQAYERILFVGESGKVEVEIAQAPPGPLVVSPPKLRNLSQNEHYQAIMQQPGGGLYGSPFSLRVLHGQVKMPPEPVLCWGEAVFDLQGNRRGAVLLTYLAGDMLQTFNEATSDRPVWLLNGDGYWLAGTIPDDLWGSLLGRETVTLAKRHPEAWQQIRRIEDGQFEDDSGLWTFATIYPLRVGQKASAVGDLTLTSSRLEATGKYVWKVVSLLPQNDYRAGGQRLAVFIWPLLLLLTGLFFALCWVSAKARCRELEFNRELEKTVDVRTAELNQRNAELERFLYTASHDLKTPLVTMSLFLDIFALHLEKNELKEIQDDMHYMQNAASKMKSLIENLLELSRIGRVVAPAEKISLRELVDEVLTLGAGAIVARGVTVKVEDRSQILYGDRVRLLEIWQNLVENAVKYMGDQENPVIDVGVEQTETGLVFYVRDNGLGIDPRYQNKVFGLFEKLDTQSEGTGIGLALVKRIVELYHGRIWVESAGVGCGSCFRFTLPGALAEPK